jgi:hypothetical protein
MSRWKIRPRPSSKVTVKTLKKSARPSKNEPSSMKNGRSVKAGPQAESAPLESSSVRMPARIGRELVQTSKCD